MTKATLNPPLHAQKLKKKPKPKSSLPLFPAATVTKRKGDSKPQPKGKAGNHKPKQCSYPS
jgi:hypothetical protein